MIELTNSNPDFAGAFLDKRIKKKRAIKALGKLTMGRNSNLRQITESESEQGSFFRCSTMKALARQALSKA